MTYDLEFDPRALKEWRKLDTSIKQQFKKKLAEILKKPKVEANKLRELPNCYRIKLRTSGYRLIYQVRDKQVLVFVVAIGKRDKSAAYKAADQRVSRL